MLQLRNQQQLVWRASGAFSAAAAAARVVQCAAEVQLLP